MVFGVVGKLKQIALASACGALLAPVIGTAQSIDAQADWAARSGASGVFYKNTFDFANRAEMLASNYGSPPLSERAEFETTNNLSGAGAIKINISKNDGESTYAYRHSFDGPVGAKTKNVRKKVFYYQFQVYLPKYILDHRFKTVNNVQPGHKFAIIMEPDQSFSTGEVVITNHTFRKFVTAYRLQGSTGTVRQFVKALGAGTNPCRPGSTDFLHQPAIDAGPQSEGGETDATSCDLFRRRYGPMHYSTTSEAVYGGGTLSEQGNPDPMAAVNGAVWVADAWNVIEVYVNEPDQTVRVWHAKRGDAPKLVIEEVGTADLGNRASNYSGVQLLPRLEERDADPTREDTYAIYDEILASDAVIAFPGGFMPGDSALVRPRPPTSLTAQ